MGWDAFLASYTIARDFQAMKKAKIAEQQAERDAIAEANAQRVATNKADENILATRAYLVELDEYIRRSLPDTFVRYEFRSPWHLWYLETKIFAGVSVGQKCWYVFSSDRISMPLALDDPESLAKQIAKHIATALQPPTIA